MSFGRKYGLVFIILGIVFCVINVVMLSQSGKYFPKLFIAGISLVTFGFSMLILPGTSPADDVPQNDKMKVWFRQSPVLNKIVWIVFGLAGIAIGFYITINFL